MVQCEVCKKQCKNSHGLDVHNRRMHNGKAAAKKSTQVTNRKSNKVEPDLVMSYCPCCGINLRAVYHAIKLTS